MFFGLSLRQFVCAALAVGTAVGLHFWLNPLLGTELTGWCCVLGAAPFAVCGFFRYHGMSAEQFAWVFLKSEVLCPRRLVFKSDCLYYEMMEDEIEKGGKRGDLLAQICRGANARKF